MVNQIKKQIINNFTNFIIKNLMIRIKLNQTVRACKLKIFLSDWLGYYKQLINVFIFQLTLEQSKLY